MLAKKTKTPRKTQKHNNLLKTKRILNNIKMPAKGGPVFRFSLPGGAACPLVPPLVTPLLRLLKIM